MDERATEAVLAKLTAAWGTMEEVQEEESLSMTWRRRAVTIQNKINDLYAAIRVTPYQSN